MERATEGIVFGNLLMAAEIGEQTQQVAIGDGFAKFAQIPVLDAHEQETAQHLAWSQSVAAAVGTLETAYKIGTNVLDEFLVLVEKISDGLEFGIEPDALLLELQVDETELGLIVTGHAEQPPRKELWLPQMPTVYRM
jgi:hypothetical protein